MTAQEQMELCRLYAIMHDQRLPFCQRYQALKEYIKLTKPN